MAIVRHKSGLIEYPPDKRALRQKESADNLDEIMELAGIVRQIALAILPSVIKSAAGGDTATILLPDKFKIERKMERLEQSVRRMDKRLAEIKKVRQ
jgi:hypothetical protein